MVFEAVQKAVFWLTLWPLVAVIWPDKGTIFKVCFETPIICFTRYNIPCGMAGGTPIMPPAGTSEYWSEMIY